MRPRQLPTAWLFTDERLGDGLWAALARLPRGGGVVFRHYGLPAGERRALLARVRAAARARRLLLVIAGGGGRASDARHIGRAVNGRCYAGLTTAAAHERAELVAAHRRGAALAFVSPVYATRSHPGAAPLGTLRFRLLVRGAKLPVAALGGMNAARFRALRPAATAWGAVDAWTNAD